MDKLLENLNQQQIEAVRHGAGPLLIVAGAGTGKTTVITRRIAYLITQKLAKPDEILALTFTEKAATEMSERVDLLLPLGFHDLWISTFHSFCERILKTHALDIGLPNDFTILDEVKQWVFIYNNFEKFNLDYYRPLGSPNRFIDALLNHFSRCKDELIGPEEYLEYAQNLRLKLDSAEKANKQTKLKNNSQEDETEIARLEEVANAYHTYQRLLLQNSFLDFGDLINYTLDLFKKRPKVLRFYQTKFKFIMVDEFQDTNYAQFQLVKLLAGDDSASARGESGQNLVVVGDDDQSIYKFRGASVSNILKFKEEFPNSRQITLTENYRTCQNILDLAYRFIQANNPDRLEVKLNIDKKLKNKTAQEGLIQVLEGQDLSAELNLVAKTVLELKNRTQGSWNDFAILIRANSAADELLPVLTSHGIPFTFLANRGLYKKPIVVDVLSYMKLLDNGHDSSALYRVLSLPKFQLAHHELSSLLNYAHKKTLSLYETLTPAQTMAEISAASKTKLKLLKESLERHANQAKTATAAEMMVNIVKDLGLEEKLKEDTAENAEARELLEQFYKKIEEFEQENTYKDLRSFLQFLDLEMQAGSEGQIKFDPNLGPESLKVLTIHSAKGLEFRFVFIVNLVDQRFPTREKREPIEIPLGLVKDILPEGDFHLQEERRLFYVAITRAKEGVFLSWAKDYGGARTKKPSQFLIETGLVPSDTVSRATGKVVFTKPPKQKQVYKTLPTKFSYSELNDFEICPLKYKYQHYLKLPISGTQQMSFGVTMHRVFEDFMKHYKNSLELAQSDLFGAKSSSPALPEFKLLEDLYRKHWIDDWYQSKIEKEKYKKEGLRILKIFYENLEAEKPRPKYLEQKFTLKLGPYDFTGKIDRADINTDQRLIILDYKTGKAPKTKKDIDQLYIYQWAAQEFLKEEVGELKYWYLQSNQFVQEELASDETVEALKTELLDVIEKIIYTIKYDLFKQEHQKLRDHQCEFEHLE